MRPVDFLTVMCLRFIIAGVATHSLDWRKSAGGFIHGYRYTGIYFYWMAIYQFVTVLPSKDHLLLILCYYRKKPELN